MADLRANFETACTGILVLLAVGLSGNYVFDRALARTGDSIEQYGVEPQQVDGWQQENARGVWMGPADAPVVVTEFMDFQCPYCARLVYRMDTLHTEHPGRIATVFHHFPLSNHPFAVPAAIAGECAYQQGRFAELHRLIFEKQDSLGVKTWDSYAKEAQVPDLARFGLCVLQPADSFPRIAYGRALGERTGVRGTPHIWINGRAIRRSDMRALRAWTSEILAQASR